MKIVLNVPPEFLVDALAGKYGTDIACQVDEAYPTHICVNCGSEFRWQVGRSTGEFARTKGVQFCTNRCAKAHAQRALRARRKAAAA